MKRKDRLAITILIAVSVVAITIAGKTIVDTINAPTPGPELTEEQQRNINLHMKVYENEICMSTAVQRTDYWLDLVHLCYNPEWGYTGSDIRWINEEDYQEKIKPVLERLREKAIEKRIYNYNHETIWGDVR